MSRFPQSFVEEVRSAADIVLVVQDVVPLRRVGASYKGLCPFHGEKTPSFQVVRERGFFYCFGCGVGGDVFKFVELNDKVGFLDAVRSLAKRFGVAIPATSGDGRDGTADAERESLLKMQEVACEWFQEQLRSPSGSGARQALTDRGLSADTVDRLGIGFAPSSREGLKLRLMKQGFTLDDAVRGGLVGRRDDGSTYDRFRNRLMIPICRESGPIVAFGGRAMAADQQPKYLNSPETPIYHKGRTLYGLNVARHAIRQSGRAVLVEGYFDFAQVLQGGLESVVATCGTALTPAQAQLLRRFTSRAVLSFDPDAAGQGAAARSCDLLVIEGFDVRVALLPSGGDPDTFVRQRGVAAYEALVDRALSWLDYLVDQAVVRHPLDRSDGRQAFLHEMLEVAARIPDAATRDQFADLVAHRARVTEAVVRAEIRKAAVARQTTVPAVRTLANGAALKTAERDLLAGLVREPHAAGGAIVELEDADFDGLRSADILRCARTAIRDGGMMPGALFERLSEEDSQLLTQLAASITCPQAPLACVQTLKELRLKQERADIQHKIQQLQDLDAAQYGSEIAGLLKRKQELSTRLQAFDS
jgi:DNA primase